MKLFHFCSKVHVRSIKTEGLTKGSIPLCNEDGFPVSKIPGLQWLTSNPDWGQEWEAGSSLPYRRNDFRIVVSIPKSHRDKLMKWDVLCEQVDSLADTAKVLNAFGDPENWYVYADRIKPGWFRGIDSHPGRTFEVNP